MEKDISWLTEQPEHLEFLLMQSSLSYTVMGHGHPKTVT